MCLCQQSYPDQALLLLVTGGLGMRILHSPLSPVLPVLSTFKVVSCQLVPFMSPVCQHVTCLKTQDTLRKPPAVLWLTVKDILWMIAGFLSEAAVKLFRFDLIIWSCVCQENLWALEWLWDTLPFTAERLASFSQEVTQEMENTTGLDICGKNKHPIIWLFTAKYYSVISLFQPRIHLT